MASLARLARKAFAPYKKQILTLTGLGFASGILEGIGINAVIPLLSSVLGLHDAATDALSVYIKDFFTWIHVPFFPRYILTFIVVLFIGKAIVTLYLSYIQIRISNEYLRATQSKLFNIFIRSSWPYLLRQKLGNLETALMIDVPASTQVLTKISSAIPLITSLLMYLVVAFSISAPVMLSTAFLGALTFVGLRPLMDRVRDRSRSRTLLYRDTMHHVGEHVAGLKSVKAFGVEGKTISLADTLFGNIMTITNRIGFTQAIAMQAVAPIGIIYIAAILALSFKTPFISFAALPAILYLIYRIFTYVQQLQNTVQYVSELGPHLERVIHFSEHAGERVESLGGDQPFSFKDELSFDHVLFSYEGGREILRGISFSIPKGNMVGIVGPSGAGKTTSVDLMLRLLEPTQGAITLDGVDCREIRLPEWRKKVAYVSQDFFLLQDTIRNNIRFYDESITDDAVWEAAKNAKIDDFIKQSPEGLDTMVGERGILLSAGERQRITIARALARRPEILILDEATSALDNESEAHIKRVIEELKGRLTIIAIAHRLSTIMDSDQLIVLSEGKVVETGTPQELLANTNSYFYKVYSINQ
ncbi:MAG: Multidrug ABC transporter protein [Candidatus Kaiserbacteria bacterium GW2011_GWA2_52_12]|uniref:Multidrug ABC transporter protein n=1 Tax=Candidatus Kaiserbacteria bacterium GW2011_GWA2_52_12 TaxID=1618671 RepID=A0A0G1X0B3_9BACT|nr:MAG: Multidrug ABC transporter protein [Candidatus Kaiserbacteria bacterium GW2011_GWA2_52_12]